MAATKLKLTDLRTGQESLLLVTKMNLKGLLVQTMNVLPAGTPVHMKLTLDEGVPPIELRGEVHKVAEKASGQKGMILRFVNPTPAQLALIRDQIGRSSTTPEAESQEYDATPSEYRTQMVAEDTLSILSFSPPVKPKKIRDVAPTVDEEAATQKLKEFVEETRLVEPSEAESMVRRDRRRPWRPWLWTVIVVLGLPAAAIWYLKGKTGYRIPSPPPEEVATVPTKAPTEAAPAPPAEVPAPEPTEAPARPPAPPPRPTPTPKPLPAEIRSIAVEETPAFLKITFGGSGLERPEVSRLTNPRRLLLAFRKIRAVSVEPTISVGKNPLLRIRTGTGEGYVQVTFDMYPVDFPRYDVQEFPNALTVYLYR